MWVKGGVRAKGSGGPPVGLGLKKVVDALPSRTLEPFERQAAQ